MMRRLLPLAWLRLALLTPAACAPHLAFTSLSPSALLHSKPFPPSSQAPLPLSLSRLRGGSASTASQVVGDYTKTAISSLILHRGGWLAVFLLSLSLTSVVMSRFEHTLAQQIELAYFVPLLIGHGGNAGGQTVGAVLGALSAGQIGMKDWASVIFKETITAVGSGSLTCIAIIPLLFIMKISWHVSAAILVTMPVLTMMASALGAALPFAVSALGTDPTVVAGERGIALARMEECVLSLSPLRFVCHTAPAMTTLVDVGGLLAYFLIARLVFAAFGMKMGDSGASSKKD